MKPINLLVEYLNNPIGIDVKMPRLFWKIDDEGQKNTKQTAYRIKASDDIDFANIIWDTDRINSCESIHIKWDGDEIHSKTKIYWQVMVWDNYGSFSEWECSSFETGFMDDEWTAEWITPAEGGDLTEESPPPVLRREFTAGKSLVKARLYITALGLYRAEINGHRIGDMELTPGWTSYENWVQYQTYDVTDNIIDGGNAIAVTLGNGWYRGPMAMDHQWNMHGGDRVALLSCLELTYEDGSIKKVDSDTSWKGGFGPIQSSEIYYGEVYDAGKETDYSKFGYDNSDFMQVKLLEKKPLCKIVGQKSPAVRKIDEVRPVEIIITPNGDTIIDFGQNLVGWVKLSVDGNAGDIVLLKHCEILFKEEFYNENYRAARSELKYILKGAGQEVYEPAFTFFWFQIHKG